MKFIVFSTSWWQLCPLRPLSGVELKCGLGGAEERALGSWVMLVFHRDILLCGKSDNRIQLWKQCFMQYICYTILFWSTDTASDDSGMHAIAEAVCHGLDKQPLDVDHVDPMFLLVLCYLFNSDMIGKDYNLRHVR